MRIIFYSLLILIILSPLPFGSNIPSAWSLCAVITALLTLLWAGVSLKTQRRVSLSLNPWIIALFLIPLIWALLQLSPLIPAAWTHPLWQSAGEALNKQSPGIISLAPDKTLTAIMRLLTYGLVFFLSFQLCRDRDNARIAIKWIATAGVAYALYGLVIYWGDFNTILLYEKGGGGYVSSTFINRNTYATYAGFSLLCAMALFLDGMTRHSRSMAGHMHGKQDRIELFVVKTWRPLVGLMLIVVALISTHSRGGFISTGVALVILLAAFRYKNKLKTKAFTGAIAAVLVVTFLAFSISSAVLLKRMDRMEIDAESRMAVYENTLEAINDNPWTGFGYGAFEEAFRLYRHDSIRVIFHKTHNTYLENLFGLGVPASAALLFALLGIAMTLLLGIIRCRRDWIYPLIGFAVTIQVAIHSLVDLSLQIPAVAITYAAITGIATAQSYRSRKS